MKKILMSIAALAFVALAASCSKEAVAPVDGEALVSFTVQTAQIQTRAIADGTTVNKVACFVYDKDGNFLKDLSATDVTMENCKATYSVRLVNGQDYQFNFFAYNEAQLGEDKAYTLSEDGKTLTVNYEGAVANDETRDAFYAHETFTAENAKTYKVVLHRPFAQLNVATTEEDWAAAVKSNITVTESAITVKGVPTTLNLTDGTVSDATVDVTFASAAIPTEVLTVGEKNYKYLSMNYLLAGADQLLVDAEMTLTANSAMKPLAVSNVPLKGNFRTNVLGNLLTTVSEIEIIVDPTPGGDENIELAGSLAELKAVFANGGTVKLTEDIVLDETLSVADGKEVVLDLNGKTISNKNDLWNTANHNWSLLSAREEATLTIKGNGTLKAKENDCYAVDVQDGSHVIIEDGTFVGNIHAVYVEEGTAEVKGGHFSVQQKYPDAAKADEFVLNCYDKNRANGTAKIIVTGGEYEKFNPADCQAEGANTNFCAEGYWTVKRGDNYIVAPKGTTPVADQAGLLEALGQMEAGEKNIFNLPDGEFSTYDKNDKIGIAKNKTLTFVGNGADKTKYHCGYDLSLGGEYGADYSLEGSDVTFKNMTVATAPSSDYKGFIRPTSLTFENCVIEGRFSYLGVGTVTFKNCTLNQTVEDYNLWLYSGNDFVFDNCTFNCVGKCINAYKTTCIEYKITIKDCTFNSTKVNKSAIELKANGDKKYKLYFEGVNKCTNFDTSTVTGSPLYNSNDGEIDSIVYIDGKKVWAGGAVVE